MFFRKHECALSTLVLCVVFGAGCGRSPSVPADLYVRQPVSFDVRVTGDAAPMLANLKKYAKMFAFPVVDADASDPAPLYRIEGELRLQEKPPVQFQETVLQYQWEIAGSLSVIEAKTGRRCEDVTVSPFVIGSKEREQALDKAVRAGSQKAARFLFYAGKVLGDREVYDLLTSLLMDKGPELTCGNVVDRLVACGDRAVPFLVWALNNMKKVALEGSLSGVPEEKKELLSVYHVANRGLERIFGKETGLAVADKDDFEHVKRLQQGWLRVWHKRCGAYLNDMQLKILLERKEKETQDAE